MGLLQGIQMCGWTLSGCGAHVGTIACLHGPRSGARWEALEPTEGLPPTLCVTPVSGSGRASCAALL